MAHRLFVTGIGPAGEADMTLRARETITKCDIIVGYTLYCSLLEPLFPDKTYITTPMTGEEERVRIALQKAEEGHDLALVCSGDAGVYGLAGLAIELAADYPKVKVEIVPGVTAALSGAALLGAPLIHDFCVISLSDRLTPIELIDKRLKAAAESDMVIVLYNPGSKSRPKALSHACDILLEILPAGRICAIASNIKREGESRSILSLSELKAAEVDMFQTVFVGNSKTARIDDFMVTPRGYKSEG